MTIKSPERRSERFSAFMDSIAEDYLFMSDDEVLEEMKAAGMDVRAEEEKTRDILAKAIETAGQSALESARKAAGTDSMVKGLNVLEWPLKSKQELLSRAQEHSKDFTLAARQASEMSESDLDSLLEDLLDLGVIDKEGNET